MVQVKDEGVFDAPLEKIWRFLQDENLHDHKSVTNSKVLEQSDKGMVMEADLKDPDGKGTHKAKLRFTYNPPKGFDMEYLSGLMTGTKNTHTYTPMGNKTKVEVAGDYRIQGLDETATKKAALAFLEEVFNEDTAALKKFK